MENYYHFIKWTARILGGLIMCFFVAYGLDEGFPIFFYLPWKEAIPWIAITTCFGGFILGWFYPLWGGIIAIAGWLLFGFAGWRFEYRDWMSPYLWILLIIGILYVLTHIAQRKAEAEEHTESKPEPQPALEPMAATPSASTGQFFSTDQWVPLGQNPLTAPTEPTAPAQPAPPPPKQAKKLKPVGNPDDFKLRPFVPPPKPTERKPPPGKPDDSPPKWK